MSTATGTASSGFVRPIGSIPSDREIASFMNKAVEGARSARQYAEVKWLVSAAYLDHLQYLTTDWYQRRIYVSPSDPKGTVRVRIPETLVRYRREKGRLLSILRVPSTRPIASGKPSIWRQNRFASGAISYLYSDTQFPDVADTFIGDLLLEGTAGILAYWDDGPDPSDNNGGRVRFRVIPGWQMYPFPASAVDDDETDGIIWSRPVSEDWIRQNIPEAINERRSTITVPFLSPDGTSYTTPSPTASEGYEVRYGFFKPNRRFPQGEQVIQVGEKIYRREGQLRFFIGNRRVIPISVARYTKKPTSWWGESFCYPICQMNREINRAMTLAVRRALVKAHPGYIIVPQGSVTKEDFKNQVGGLVEYRMPIGAPGAQPAWLVPPSGSPENDVLINRVQLLIDDVSSQHAATQGEAAGRVDSAVAIQNLIRQDAIPAEGSIRQIDRCIRRSFAIALDIASRRWLLPRKVSIMGPAGIMGTMKVRGVDLPDLGDIEIVTGLDMAMDRPMQVQFLTSLASPSSRGTPPLLSPEEYRRGLMALGVHLPGVNLVSPDEETAWAENAVLYGDGDTPGAVPPVDPALEDVTVHLRVHRQFASSVEVHGASPAVRAAFAAHIRETIQYIQGMPMPSQMDSGLADADTEELEESVMEGPLGASY